MTEDKDRPVRPDRRAYMADRYRGLAREDKLRLKPKTELPPPTPTEWFGVIVGFGIIGLMLAVIFLALIQFA